jgi:chemotaxis protein methyltransferase CheR
MTDEIERFRAIVERRLGLAFEDGKLGFLGDVLARRLDATGLDRDRYLNELEHARVGDELGAIAQELTVGETYFFRNAEQFRALVEVALPDRIRAQRSARRLRILSAGCASGEEAYSIAIAARELLPDPAWDIAIRAVDVNPAALERARRAVYTAWALRETPTEPQRRYFRTTGRETRLDDAVRGSVVFEHRNLAAGDAELWVPASYDVIFCRNVIMYFALDQQRALVERIADALAPGGYLFLGHAETLRGLSQRFHLCHSHNTFYYQRRDHDEPELEAAHPGPVRMMPLAVPLAEVVDHSGSWVDVIREAAERVEALTARSPAHPAAPARWDLAGVFELMQRERFGEALELVRGLPPESARDPDVLLIQAVLLVHAVRLDAAEEVCRRLLAIDELAAGAHYVLALCREGVGDRNGAEHHDQTAAYLDPTFAMPRLHLGLLARRAHDRSTARRELGQALVLLQREEPSRLLLFGGGFHRDALIALCRAELAACGGAP